MSRVQSELRALHHNREDGHRRDLGEKDAISQTFASGKLRDGHRVSLPAVAFAASITPWLTGSV
jgi:hypothetical protein